MNFFNRIWPFGSEKRATSFYGLTVDEMHDIVEFGGSANPNQTAAVEFALGLVSRAFMTAVTVPRIPTCTPLMLSMLARQTVSLGNAVFQLVAEDGELQLLPVAKYEIVGGPRPRSWMYTFRQQQPNGENPIDTDDLPQQASSYDGMVHVRNTPHPESPWRGVSPLIAAGVTAGQLAKIEQSLSYDASVPTGGLLPLPDGVTATQANAAKSALTTGKGKTTLVETTRGGFGQGSQAAPQHDWGQARFGAMIPAANIDMREKSALAVMAAMGIPPSLYTSEGSAQRESYRHFLGGTVASLGALIEEELSAKFEQPIRIEFPQSWISDISARSRAFGTLVKAGMSPVDAARIAGLPTDFETIAAPVPEPQIDMGELARLLDSFEENVHMLESAAVHTNGTH